MFDACRDLEFLEQLNQAGFRGGLFVMHVNHAAFYQSGLQTGIYSYFRGGVAFTGAITKPTGKKNQVVRLCNSYSVRWQPYSTSGRYGSSPSQTRLTFLWPFLVKRGTVSAAE